jgi:hypothetical protein
LSAIKRANASAAAGLGFRRCIAAGPDLFDEATPGGLTTDIQRMGNQCIREVDESDLAQRGALRLPIVRATCLKKAGSVVSASAISGDKALLMGVPSDVAFKWLRVLHIRLNLPENRPRSGRAKETISGVGNAGSTYVVLF